MTQDTQRVVLKKNGKVFVDGADTGWTWNKTSGFHPEYVLHGSSTRINHYRLKTFKLKVLDFHNGCGEFA